MAGELDDLAGTLGAYRMRRAKFLVDSIKERGEWCVLYLSKREVDSIRDLGTDLRYETGRRKDDVIFRSLQVYDKPRVSHIDITCEGARQHWTGENLLVLNATKSACKNATIALTNGKCEVY